MVINDNWHGKSTEFSVFFSWMFKRWYLWIEFIILIPGFWLLLLGKSMPRDKKCRILDTKLLILFTFKVGSFFLKNWFFCSRCHRNLTKKLLNKKFSKWLSMFHILLIQIFHFKFLVFELWNLHKKVQKILLWNLLNTKMVLPFSPIYNQVKSQTITVLVCLY